MPKGPIHKIYYDLIKEDYSDAVTIDNDIFQNVMDGHDDTDNINLGIKKLAHKNFDFVKDRYILKKNISHESMVSTNLVHTLKYYWICHLVVDMVQNESKNYIPWWDIRNNLKRISLLGEPYNSYGYNLLLKMGISPKYFENKKNRNVLIVNTNYVVDPNRIQFTEPLKTIIHNDYIIAKRFHLEHNKNVAKRIENYTIQYGRPPGFISHRA